MVQSAPDFQSRVGFNKNPLSTDNLTNNIIIAISRVGQPATRPGQVPGRWRAVPDRWRAALVFHTQMISFTEIRPRVRSAFQQSSLCHPQQQQHHLGHKLNENTLDLCSVGNSTLTSRTDDVCAPCDSTKRRRAIRCDIYSRLPPTTTPARPLLNWHRENYFALNEWMAGWDEMDMILPCALCHPINVGSAAEWSL